MNIKNIKSIDLLHKFFELKSLVNSEEWSEENFKDNEPRLYWYQQLKAIFLAFEIPFDIDKFMSGEFIDHTDKKYTNIINNISNEMGYKVNGEGLRIAFKRLIIYCSGLKQSLFYNNGVLLSTNEFEFANKKIYSMNNIIKKNILDIENILSSMACPKNQTFTIDELNLKYNYPIVDLRSIDIDNL